MTAADNFTIRVLSLNMWGIPFAAAERRLRVEAVARHLATLPVDVVGLQEAWLPTDRERIIRAAARNGLHYSHYFRSGLVGSGLLVLSRYPIAATAFWRFRLGGYPEMLNEGDYYAGKGIGLTRLLTPIGNVDVYNTHTVAQYIYDDAHDPYRGQRTASAYEITEFIRAQSSEGYPVIFTGDFNMRPEQPATAIVRQLGGLTDCWAACNPNSPGYTYDTANPYITAEHAERIDYVYCRNRVTPIHAEIALTHAEPVKNGLPRAYSDHYGLLVDLRIGSHEDTSPAATDNEIASKRDISPTVVDGVSDENLLRTLGSFLAQTEAEAQHRAIISRQKAESGWGFGLLYLMLYSRSKKWWWRALFGVAAVVALLPALFQSWLTLGAQPDELRAIAAIRGKIKSLDKV